MNFPTALIEGIGGPELLLVLFIVLLLFGAKGLPDLARGLGKTTREFKKAASGVEQEFRSAMADAEREEVRKKQPVGAQPRKSEPEAPVKTPAAKPAPPPDPSEPTD